MCFCGVVWGFACFVVVDNLCGFVDYFCVVDNWCVWSLVFYGGV